MPKDNLTVHMVVKNEDKFIYYSISSVLNFARKIMICDTGSTDHTEKIIKSFKNNKIILTRQKVRSGADLGKIRQKQLEDTQTDWFWIVDGDEIYPESLCEEIDNIIQSKGDNLEGIIVRRLDLIGDIYHYQSESVGFYNLFGKKGHFAIRLLNKKNIPGLHVEGNYPLEGYYDKNRLEIIHHSPDKYVFTEGKLFHAMYLDRSTEGPSLMNTLHRNKWKTELGNKIDDSNPIPEVFNIKKPDFIPDVRKKRRIKYTAKAILITPFKKIKRRMLG